jgi:hypothetical protein
VGEGINEICREAGKEKKIGEPQQTIELRMRISTSFRSSSFPLLQKHLVCFIIKSIAM